MLIILALIFIALLFDFLNGMNDAANAIATVVSTRVLTPRQAVLWAAFFNFAAAFVFGLAVANTIGKGIIDPNIVNQHLIFAALFGAIIWTHICTQYGLPISVSHALIGGLIGAALVKAGTEPLIWSGLIKVALFIILSPVIGLIISFILMIVVMWTFRSWTNRKVDRIFRAGQLFSSAFYSLGHGTNDAQKTMGIIAVMLFTSGVDMPAWFYDKSAGFYIPTWVVMAAYTAIGLGTLSGGWKVIRTLGVKLTHLKPIGGFCAETGGSIVLLGTALVGIPVSTTHTIAGAIMGVGATRRLSAVRWGIVGKIVMAWILTIPASALMASLVYYITGIFIR
jgi:inorganic phosphate transporter, PiT family